MSQALFAEQNCEKVQGHQQKISLFLIVRCKKSFVKFSPVLE